jgi:predicted Rossmann fold nucleotide-binding protein DprA/Smf involved in DNA uptake
MTFPLTSNTKAILLLTAPLMIGRRQESAGSELAPLTKKEYKSLALRLRTLDHEPADLIATNSSALINMCASDVGVERINALLARGFLLSQAVDQWATRGIWVISRADPKYPTRLKTRMRDDAPTLLYGCGDVELLETGGLAVVGSRNIQPELSDFSYSVGKMSAESGHLVISGGARGVDEAAVAGCVESGGFACEVLAEDLMKASVDPHRRSSLSMGRLTLVSPYDPSSRFLVGHALQRNKLIYALADLALVVNSDFKKGGTWAGAIEQLQKLHYVPVFVRSSGPYSAGLEQLQELGARCWPNIIDASTLDSLIREAPAIRKEAEKRLPSDDLFGQKSRSQNQIIDSRPGDILFDAFRQLLDIANVKNSSEEKIASELDLDLRQVQRWMMRIEKG